MGIPAGKLRAYQKERERRLPASLTRENIIGARKLAYDLRHNGVDKTAREHWDSFERSESKAQFNPQLEQLSREAEALNSGRMIFTPGANDEYTEKPWIKSRTFWRNNVKIEQVFSEGKLVSETAIPLS